MGTVRIPGLVLTDHFFRVPLDHGRPEGEQIEVYAREVVAPGRDAEKLPWLLFLQGGPGLKAPRPESRSGWLKRALDEFRVLLLDQRGTGLSTPVSAQTLAQVGTAEEQAEYLTHFRADSIVQDAELIRRQLVGVEEPWSVLGQSYGGFCIAHYLSAAPEGLREVILTGGLPPLSRSIDEVYRATYRRVIEQNRRFFQRYPDDQERVRRIVDHLRSQLVSTPGGSLLSARRFQQIGQILGSWNGFERLHYLLEEALVRGARGQELSYSFLREVQNLDQFETQPIYAILHEPIYCECAASNWSAERVRGEFSEFDPDSGGPLMFTGEMIYPWMFDDYVQLRPLKVTAEILASYDAWPALYDLERLRENQVPCAATIYADDMYVERSFAENSASMIRGTRVWLTNEYDHGGLRKDGDKVLGRLLEMLRGEV